MKRLTTLAVFLLGAALLAGAAPAAAKHRPDHPPAFRHYIACGLSEKAKPSRSCHKRWKKGAFFRSTRANVSYTVCVKFPTKKHLCVPKQEALEGTLYVNKITSNIPGWHKVTWFVRGKRVAASYFKVFAKAPRRQRGKANRR